MADESFIEFALDQLNTLPQIRARRMFGAYGLYQADRFFAILDEGRLFFKTDAKSQEDYTARGMMPFTYLRQGRTTTMGFHEVPPEVLDNSAELTVWANRAIQVAATASMKSAKKPKH